MTAQTFNQFSLLPGEIRDQIWDMAVRPHGTRGVHYFSLFECHPHPPLPDRFNRTIKKTIYCQPKIIGVPLPQDDASPHSWTEGNRSTYAIDGGLWTACKESRAAMQRRYDLDSWAEFYVTKRKICDGDGGGKQYFTVLPLYDLIYLQPWNSGLDFWNFVHRIPFVSPQFGFAGVRHIALKYDRSWTVDEVWQFHREWKRLGLDDSEEGQEKLSTSRWQLYKDLTGFLRDSLSFDSQIWLVDHRLRRESTVLDERDTEMVFGKYGGWKRQLLTFHGEDGRRYYTMPEGIESRYCDYDEDDDHHDSNKDFDDWIKDYNKWIADNVWGFIDAIEEVAALMEADEQRIDVDIDDAPTVRRLGIRCAKQTATRDGSKEGGQTKADVDGRQQQGRTAAGRGGQRGYEIPSLGSGLLNKSSFQFISKLLSHIQRKDESGSVRPEPFPKDNDFSFEFLSSLPEWDQGSVRDFLTNGPKQDDGKYTKRPQRKLPR
ncbi:hypothetical protein CMUS01_06585 [Colletotrichum musicola]|uniref:2EXR domain-containing protein n=1 Tax=Colletotrichum musicola TaxID=2175873 RepID=A0A8H6KKQ9_9PEZI|nr:hypothetical protein CMUS01_06585 [Colletotrichum musicola]